MMPSVVAESATKSGSMPARLSAFTALGPASQDLRAGEGFRVFDRSEEKVHSDTRVENDVVDLRVLADRDEAPGS